MMKKSILGFNATSLMLVLFALAACVVLGAGHEVHAMDMGLGFAPLIGCGMADQLTNLQNVRPGAVAILELPCSVTYDKIHLRLGGPALHALTAANITKIEGKANGKTFMVETGLLAQKRQAYKGLFVDTSVITLDFTEPNSRGGAVPQYMASIPANLLSKLTFEITIAANADALGTMTADCEFRDPTQNPFIRKLILLNQPAPNTGDNDIYLPAGASGGLVKRLWMHGADVLTQYDLRVDRVTKRRQTKAVWQHEQKENALVPQPNLDVIDFIADGNMMGTLNTGGDGRHVPEVRLVATTSASENFAIYLEYIDPIGRL